MSELWFVIFGSLGIIVGASVILAASAETRIGRYLGTGAAIGVLVLGIILWGALDGPVASLTSTEERWLLISTCLGIVVGACAVLGWMASRGRGGHDKAEGFSGVPGIVKIRILAVLIASMPVVIIAVGNLRPPVTWWEHEGIPTSADPNENHIAEVHDPASCVEDATVLAVRGVGTFANGSMPLGSPSFEPDAKLPDGATFTGWYAGERELWVETSVSQGRQTTEVPVGFGLTPPDAVYVVSPWGVERWPRTQCG